MTRYASEVDQMTTVCQSIAEEYERDYGLKCNAIVMNLPPEHPDLAPSPVNGQQIRLVHHGGLNRNRKLETMIDLMDMLDERFTLDFYLVKNQPAYLEELKGRAKSQPRIRFHDAVPPTTLPGVLNEHDLGLYPLCPSVPNQRMALPNKFFDFIQARLGVAIWPSVEMKRVVERFDLGIVTQDFDLRQLADLLNGLTKEQIEQYKRNSDMAARELHSGRTEEIIRQGVAACLN
jgi:glycosyltransferase involved in cell wall biosynthesis